MTIRIAKLARACCLASTIRTVCAAWVVLAGFGFAQPVYGEVPVAALVSREPHTGFTLSPGGSYLTSATLGPKGYVILVSDVDTGRLIYRIHTGPAKVINTTWATDRRIVIEMVGGMVAVNVDGSQQVALLAWESRPSVDFSRIETNTWKVLHTLPDEPDFILVANAIRDSKIHVYRLNIVSGQKRLLIGDELNVDEWMIDREGRVRLGTKMVDGRLKMFYRKHERRPWESFDAYGDESDVSFEFGGSNYLNQRIFIHDFGYDPLHLYVASDLRRNTKRLGIFDLLTQRVYQTLVWDQEYDVGDPRVGSTRLLFLESEKKLAGVRYETDLPKMAWFDDRFSNYQKRLDEKLPNTFNEILDYDHTGETLLVRAWSDRNPGDIFVYQPKGDQLKLVIQTNAALKNYTLSESRPISYRARDGRKIHGYLNLPPKPVENPPLVMFVHGGPWARDSWGYDPVTQALATSGFAVLRVNFRGSAGYGREHLLAGVKEFGGKMIDDIADGALWAGQRGYCDPERIGIMGASYGGYASLAGVIRYPEIFKAALPMMAPVEMNQFFAFLKAKDSQFPYAFWAAAVGDPEAEAEMLRTISPVHQTEKITAPVHAFYCGNDPIIPIEQADMLKAAMAGRGDAFAFTLFPNEGHAVENPKNLAFLLETSRAFFGKHLQ